MMKLKACLVSVLTLMVAFCANAQQKVNVKQQLKLIVQQYKGMINPLTDSSLSPQSVNPDGSIRIMPTDWWCSGFFPGSLWYLYGYTDDISLKTAAEKWTLNE